MSYLIYHAVVDFYQNLGFEADPEGIKGMFWYPKQQKNGTLLFGCMLSYMDQ